MAKMSPLKQVNQQFGSKEKLVDALVGMVDRGEESKDDFRNRLLAAANNKLLRLHAAHKTMNDDFGSKDKLVDAVVSLMKRPKDNDFREKLADKTPIQLLSLHSTWQRSGNKKPGGKRAA